jgi:exosortase
MVLSTSNRESVSKLSPFLIFPMLAAISLAVWWASIASTFALALHDDQFTHILLILPISAALIFLDWKSPEASTGSSVRVASVLMVVALAATVILRRKAVAWPIDVQLSAKMLALVVFWIASFALCFGKRSFRLALFPLCFLFWLVPFPDFVLDPVVSFLQQDSAAAAHWLFAAAGVPVAQRGVLVHIPGLTVEVARECSSIRSSLMLVVTTMVLAQLLLRSPWRKALVIAIAIPLSIAKNGLRIFVIAMLATRVDPSFLTGRLHRQGGIIFFLIALAVVFLLLWTLRRGEENKQRIAPVTGALKDV